MTTKCSSCQNGFDGSNGNGYQPCSCSSKTKDGGPAYPQGKAVGHIAKMEGGMTLRDKFADSAMQGIVVNCGRNGYDIDEPDAIAIDAYKMADAMLAAREQK